MSAPTKSASCAASGGLTVLGRVVRGQCDVRLSAKVGEPGILYARGNTRDDKYAVGIVRRALRDPDEVDVAVKWLRESGARELYRMKLELKRGSNSPPRPCCVVQRLLQVSLRSTTIHLTLLVQCVTIRDVTEQFRQLGSKSFIPR